MLKKYCDFIINYSNSVLTYYFNHNYIKKIPFLMIKVFSWLIFYHFFQNLILKFIDLWLTSDHEYEKGSSLYFFYRSSNLIIILLHDNAWSHITKMTILGHMLPEWHYRISLIWDFATPTIFSWSLTHQQSIFQASGHFFYPPKHSVLKEK